MNRDALEPTAIDAAGRFRIGGRVCTGEQLQKALQCAQALAWAYERAAEDNGGNGSVRWEDVDAASRAASDAMGVSTMAKIISDAQQENASER